MGVLQGDLRGKRTSIDTGTGTKRIGGQRASHVGRGDLVNYQKDLGISATESSAKKIRGAEAEFKGQVGEQKGRISTAEKAIEKGEKELKANMVPVKYYNSDGSVYSFNLPRDTAEQLYKNPDNFAAFSESDKKYVPTSLDQARHHVGGNRNIEGYKKITTEAGKTPVGWRQARTRLEQTPKEGGGKYAENVLHLKASSSKASGAWADALVDMQKKSDAALAKITGTYDNSKAAVTGAKGILKGQEAAHQGEWDAVHKDYAERQETMKKILGGLNFG